MSTPPLLHKSFTLPNYSLSASVLNLFSLLVLGFEKWLNQTINSSSVKKANKRVLPCKLGRSTLSKY